MISISVGEAKNKLPYFLHLVEEKDESVQITRHGKAVAYINTKDTASGTAAKVLADLAAWKNKYSDVDFGESEPARNKTTFSVRHPEDFE